MTLRPSSDVVLLPCTKARQKHGRARIWDVLRSDFRPQNSLFSDVMVSLNSHVTYVCLSDKKPKAIEIFHAKDATM